MFDPEEGVMLLDGAGDGEEEDEEQAAEEGGGSGRRRRQSKALEEPDVLYSGSVNRRLVDRKYHVYGLYQNENLVSWLNGCGNQGGQRLQQALDKKTFTSAVICSSRTRSDELGYTRGHAQLWYDGHPVVPAGEQSFAYWSIHFSKSSKGSAQGYHWYYIRRGAPVLWLDHLHDQGYVVRGIGFVHEVRTVPGVRYETNIKYEKQPDGTTVYHRVADPQPRRVYFTHVKFRMYTAATIIDAAWLNLLQINAITSGAFEPDGWTAYLRRYFKWQTQAPMRRFIQNDAVRGMQPLNLREDDDMRLPAQFRRGRNTNIKKQTRLALDEQEDAILNDPNHPRGVSILYEDYIKLLTSIQYERGALNGQGVPGAPPASGLAYPGLAPEWMAPDL